MKACGTCQFYQVDAKQITRGSCNYEPPMAAVITSPKGATVLTYRRDVNNTDVACSKFMARTPDAPRLVARTRAEARFYQLPSERVVRVRVTEAP